MASWPVLLRTMRTLAGVSLLALALGALPAGAEVVAPGNITTVAGGPGQGQGNDVGQGPQGLAAWGTSVYVADSANDVVRVIDTLTGEETAGDAVRGFAGDGGPASSARLSSPADVAVDAEGNLFIADGSSRVRRVDAATGTITTVAGNGSGGFSGDGGPAVQAQLLEPIAVEVDDQGNIFIAEAGNFRVRKVAASGIITTVAGSGVPGNSGDDGPATSARMSPFGLAVDASGNLFISAGNNRVRKVDASGTNTAYAGSGLSGSQGDGGPATTANLWGPAGLAIDGGGDLLIADRLNHRVRKVDGTTRVISTVAGTGIAGSGGDGAPATSAQLDSPWGLAVASDGQLLIGDRLRVREVDVSGTITTAAGNGFQSIGGDGGPAVSAQIGKPDAIAVDPAENLYIVDRFNNRIRRVDPAGIVTTYAGTGPSGTGSFGGDGGPAEVARLNGPRDAVPDGAGGLFIADRGNHRIRRVAATGAISTYVGTGSPGFSGDGGAASQAQLNAPAGVAVDGTGNLFIYDVQNRRIRKVDAAGVITTYAGSGQLGSQGDGGPALEAQRQPSSTGR